MAHRDRRSATAVRRASVNGDHEHERPGVAGGQQPEWNHPASSLWRVAEEHGMKTRLMVDVEHDDLRTVARVMAALGDDMPHDYKERGVTMAPELRFTTTLREDEIARQLAEFRAEVAE